jgi:PAS domain S-box-containing protein/putative nucleotidyltransferase with HDIG domain
MGLRQPLTGVNIWPREGLGHMQWQLSLSVLAEAGTALAILIIAVYFPWRDVSRRANLIGSSLLVIATFWILTHALEIGIPVASTKAYLMGLQLVWGLIALTLWLMYIIHYTAARKWQTSRIYALFSLMPLLALLAVATNHIYGLMWTAPGLDIHNPYLPLKPTYGLAYWACMAYMGALIASGSFLILKKVVRQHNFRRWEPWPLILAAVLPLLVAFLEVTDFTPSLGLTIGITPFFSSVGSIVLTWSLPRFHLQRVIPVARYTVFEQIGDGVVVLNMQNRIVDLNPAAERLAGYASSEALGLPVEQVWANWPSHIVLSEQASPTVEELILARSGERKTYNLHPYTIPDQKNRPLNKVVLMIETTERKRVEEQIRQSHVRLKRSFEAIVKTISATVEIRDAYTAGHQQRVAQLAGGIARELGLSGDRVHEIYTAAIIHDIGKIQVPSEILSKPGKLSQPEFSLIKGHSQVGYDILKNADFPYPLSQWVLEHHERLNGSGYPNGLTAGQISLEGKILAVADVVEAMASHRPYRPSLGIENALAEISEQKGVLYDADVADACLKLFKEEEFKFE